MDVTHWLVRPLLILLATCTVVVPAASQAQGASWEVSSSVTVETEAYAPKLSPNGRWVAGFKDLDDRQMCIWRVSDGEERCNDESSRVADASIAWSPDSRFVAWSQNGHQLDSDIFVLDVLNDSLTNYTEDEVDDLKSGATASQYAIFDRWPVWNADGSELFFLRILDPRSEIGQRQISVSRIVLETGQVIRGQDITTNEPLELIAEILGVVTPPVLTADGQLVFAVRGGADVAGVYLVDPNQQQPELVASNPAIQASNVPVLTGADGSGERISFYWLWGDFGIDGEQYPYGWLDMASMEIHPLDVRAPRGMHVACPPRLSPDGSSIVYAVSEDAQTNLNSTVVVQDLESGETVEVATGVTCQLWEGVTGLTWTAADQIVVPLDDGSFEVISLEGA